MTSHEALPTYSGRDSHCPKCGNTGASVQYFAYGECVHGGMVLEVAGYMPNERLHRECSNCSYMWDEKVLDFDRTGIPK